MSEASPKSKDRTPVVFIIIAMDQGGSSRMRRQIVHKTTRANCDMLKAIKFAITSCNIIHYRSFHVRLRAIFGLIMHVLCANQRTNP